MEIAWACPAMEDKVDGERFSMEVCESLAEVQEAMWNAQIPADNPLMQWRQLRLLEQMQQERMRFRYVMIKDKETSIGCAYFQIVSFSGEQLMNYYPKKSSWWIKAGEGISRQLLSPLRLNMLVCGNIFMTGESGFYFHNGIDRATSSRLLRQAVQRVLTSDPSLHAVLLADLYAPQSAFDLGFRQSGYSKIQVESDMSFALRSEWKTFEDYLQALSSKYRVRAKRVYALCHANGVSRIELGLPEIRQNEQTLYDLYSKVMQKASFRLGELTSDYFRRQKEYYPDNYHVYAYCRQGVIISFISFFCWDKTMEVHYTGMDHDRCRPVHLYQRMMYDMVKFGIERRVNRLHFGRTALEIKSTIGAKPQPMYGYLKHRNWFFNQAIIKTYAKRLKPSDYVIRNPFKEE